MRRLTILVLSCISIFACSRTGVVVSSEYISTCQGATPITSPLFPISIYDDYREGDDWSVNNVTFRAVTYTMGIRHSIVDGPFKFIVPGTTVMMLSGEVTCTPAWQMEHMISDKIASISGERKPAWKDCNLVCVYYTSKGEYIGYSWSNIERYYF